MATIGYLKELIKNNHFSPEINSGLEYLEKITSRDFQDIAINQTEKIEIRGRDIFALNQIYQTKENESAKFEAHRKYIDLQFIFSGEEKMRIASVRDMIPLNDYDPEKDVRFFQAGDFSELLLKAGMVAIFFPEDIHAPGLKSKNVTLVKKSVIKVSVPS